MLQEQFHRRHYGWISARCHRQHCEREGRDIGSIFSVGETTALRGEIKGLHDFELISFLIIR